MNQIKHAEYVGGGLKIVHENDPNDDFVVSVIRAGIVWPTADAPGYFCTVGQLLDYNESHRKPVVLLTEHECKLPKDLIEKIRQIILTMQCKAFYSDINEKTIQFYEEMEEYLQKFYRRSIVIDEPYLKDWINGILSLQQRMHDKAIKVREGTILRKQIAGMVDEDRDESNRSRLFAVDALRCVLGSFDLPAQRPVIIKKSNYVYT